MAWLHKASDTGKLFSSTELTEARTAYPPERNIFPRLDKVMCFMISIFGEKQDSRMDDLLKFVCLPFVMAYPGNIVLMARSWETKGM
jgi:hypothetical protein